MEKDISALSEKLVKIMNREINGNVLPLARQIRVLCQNRKYKSAEAYKISLCAIMLHVAQYGNKSTVTESLKNVPSWIPSEAVKNFFNDFSTFEVKGESISFKPKKSLRLGQALEENFQRYINSAEKSIDYLDILSTVKNNPLNIDFSRYTPHQLLELWRACIRVQASKKSLDVDRSDAQDFQILINNEWVRRYKGKLDKNGHFKWPKTNVSIEVKLSKLRLDKSPAKGVLSMYGYHVGKQKGVESLERKLILMSVFSAIIPPFFSEEYLRDWGSCETPQRLRKIAYTLAAEIKGAKRKKIHDMEVAIAEWQEDLDYLYEHLYVGRFKFSWPK